MKKINQIICGWNYRSWALLLIRIGVGIIFIYNGWQKFSNLSGTVRYFGALHIPTMLAYVVATVELLGGVAVILGIFTGIAGILLLIVMIVALLVIPQHGFGPRELPFITLLATAAIVAGGVGKYSLHNRFCKGCKVCAVGNTCNCSCECCGTDASKKEEVKM